MSDETPNKTDFREFDLIKPVLKALDDVGYEIPTPIQSRIIPLMMEGRDVLGQAQTGTGKTAAFALPLLSRIDPGKHEPQALVLTPTRELAIQVAEAFQRYAAHIKGFHVLPIYGGQGYDMQFRQLKRGVHVVVGTPGRVMDHMRRKTLDLKAVRCLVLDEADEMLHMGFIEDVEWILDQIPEGRQLTLFSATIPAAIRRIAQKHLNNPIEVTIDVRTTTADTIRHRYWMVDGVHKLDALTRILETEPFDGILIFVRTKTGTVELADKLSARGYACAPLNGDIPQKMRERTTEELKSGRLDILVATDVAARGLDLERISHVINYDVPYDTESYVHRVGRTGRAGRSGDAILFVTPREQRMLAAIEKGTRQKIDRMKLPSTEAINNQRLARFNQRITDTLAAGDTEFFAGLMDRYCNAHNVPPLDVAAALARMLQGDKPLLLEDKPGKAASASGEETSGKKPRTKRGKQKPVEIGMERFRVEVGLDHDVKAANIVGAIVNEAGLDGGHVGRIQIFDNHSFVDLPEGMPKDIFMQLKKVWVAGRQLQITREESRDSEPVPRRRVKDKRGADRKSKRNKGRTS
ncbi:MAG TPA: DEAD/DEAH box helicase [Acidobacteriota bacterium]|nr:DEAD/DEAH box helicase [Acidobacteriota bacterium]